MVMVISNQSSPQTSSGKKILFSATPTEKRVALLENNKVVELVVERPDSCRIVGNIYRGKVTSILPGLQAAFVDVGLEKSAFLHTSDIDASLLLESNDALMEKFGMESDSDGRRRKPVGRVPIEKLLEVGQQILVQVAKEPISTKGAKITTQVSLAGRFLVLVPDTDFIGVSKKTEDSKMRRRLKAIIAQMKPPGIGFIVRTIGLNVAEEDFIAEIQSLIEAWRTIQQEALSGSGPKLVYKEMGITTMVIRDFLSDDVAEVHVDQKDDYDEIIQYLNTMSPHLCSRVALYSGKVPLFDTFNIEKDLELSLKRKVWLRSGGYILLDHAEALLAIDVNTGRNVGKKNPDDTILQTNLEAASEIGRQFRLRDIGGIIVVDFIDMRNLEHRRRVEAHMRKVLEADSSTTSSTPLSKFGLMEMTRKRVRPELQELYTDVCHACNGLGWVFSPATVSTRIDRWLKRADFEKIPKELSLALHPAVATFLHKEGDLMLKKIELEHGVHITCLEDELLEQDEFVFYPKGETTPLAGKNAN